MYTRDNSYFGTRCEKYHFFLSFFGPEEIFFDSKEFIIFPRAALSPRGKIINSEESKKISEGPKNERKIKVLFTACVESDFILCKTKF